MPITRHQTIKFQCLREGCDGSLREWPFIMLSCPPIHQYECRSCKQKYQGRPSEELHFHQSNIPFDWAEVFDVIHPILNNKSTNEN